MCKWNTYPTNSSSSNLWLCFGATSLNHVGHQSPGGSGKSYQRHLLIQHSRIHNGPRYWLILLDHKTGLRSWCKCLGVTGKQKQVPDNWQVSCQLANWHWQRHFHAPIISSDPSTNRNFGPCPPACDESRWSRRTRTWERSVRERVEEEWGGAYSSHTLTSGMVRLSRSAGVSRGLSNTGPTPGFISTFREKRIISILYFVEYFEF